MSKTKLLVARELIQEKKYNEARSILMQIHDPTAQKWLVELDRISPNPPIEVQNKVAQNPIAGISSTTIMATLSIMLLVTLFIAIYGAFLRPIGIIEAAATNSDNWEYIVVELQYLPKVSPNGTLSAEAQAIIDKAFTEAKDDDYIIPIMLNALGADGWEMINLDVVSESSYGKRIYYFKRHPKMHN